MCLLRVNCFGAFTNTEHPDFTEFYSALQCPLPASTEPESARRETVPISPIPGGRRSRRIATKKRANLVIDISGQKMFPCLAVDRSQDGFRVKGNFKLKRGQLVELVVDDPMDSVRCEVIWVGRAGSQQEGQAGVQTVGK